MTRGRVAPDDTASPSALRPLSVRSAPAIAASAATAARYRSGTMLRMAMNLRLTDAESEALRAKAQQEGRSMQDVARTAIAQYVSDRPGRLLAAIDRVRTEDRELLERLSR